ncbi:N-terminal domain of NEFA-interacting nuclear protein NIP30 [Fragilaria crotonensis]|nr:N-terminal domain of NEFA-interacting nuclear protein NIP30 [Fragilaria crotonensis]
MSLSFVSSAVLSSTDGVSHNEETEVTSKELEAVRKNAIGGSSKSLFDQLRSNQDELAEEKAEAERARMRGTLALDEDDVAHLNALMRSKAQSELQRKVEMDQEMALFRAAREERRSGHVVIDDDDEDNDGDNHDNKNQATIPHSDNLKPVLPSLIPKIVGKRRRKEPQSDIATDSKKQKTNS